MLLWVINVAPDFIESRDISVREERGRLDGAVMCHICLPFKLAVENAVLLCNWSALKAV